MFCVVLLAAAIRLAWIDDQSIWFDEYNALLKHPDTSFARYMAHVRDYNPDHSPVYFCIVYVWMKYVSFGADSVRLLSMTFALGVLPGLFMLGRRLRSGRAGLYAALLYALAPVHVHFDIEARYISLTMLLAVWSVVALVAALQEIRSKYWWALLFLCNTLLVWLHLLSGLLLLCEGLYVLARRAPLSRVVLFVVGNVPACSALLFSLGVVSNPIVVWYAMPPLRTWLNDLMGDLALYSWLGASMPVESRGWQGISVDLVLLGLMTVVLGWNLWFLYRGRGRGSEVSTTNRLFLLIIALVPIAVLTALSLVWEPVLLTRYTLYSHFGLFLLAGLLVCGVRWKYLRIAIAIALPGLLVYQLASPVLAYTRTDWKGAAAYIEAGFQPGDRLYFADIREYSHRAPGMLQLAFGDEPSAPMEVFPTLDGAASAASNALSDSSGGAVWLVYVQPVTTEPSEELASQLRTCGMRLAMRKFTDVWVLRIFGESACADAADAFSFGFLDYAALAKQVGLEPTPETQEVLRRAWEDDFLPEMSWDWAQIAFDVTEINVELGEAVARHAAEVGGELAFTHAALGAALLAAGKTNESQEAFRNAVNSKRASVSYARLFQLLAEGNYVGAHLEAKEAAKAGVWIPPALSDAIARQSLRR